MVAAVAVEESAAAAVELAVEESATATVALAVEESVAVAVIVAAVVVSGGCDCCLL